MIYAIKENAGSDRYVQVQSNGTFQYTSHIANATQIGSIPNAIEIIVTRARIHEALYKDRFTIYRRNQAGR